MTRRAYSCGAAALAGLATAAGITGLLAPSTVTGDAPRPRPVPVKIRSPPAWTPRAAFRLGRTALNFQGCPAPQHDDTTASPKPPMPPDRLDDPSASAPPDDPVRAVLVDALTDLRRRYHRALIVGGTAPEFADAACEKADAALALARGERRDATRSTLAEPPRRSSGREDRP